MKRATRLSRKARIVTVIACVSIGWALWNVGDRCNAQTSPTNLQPQLQEVVKLAQAHMSDDVILAYVQILKNSGAAYILTADEILYLNSQGVSQKVITALLQSKSAGNPNMVPKSSSVGEPPPLDSTSPNPPPANLSGGSLPSAQGQSPTSIFTTLASFNGANGGGPSSPLFQASDGSFYGTTYYGGPNGSGTIFLMTPSGALTSLFSCGAYGGTALVGDKTYGTHFFGAPVQGNDGSFYVTTVNDGPTGWGAVLQMTPSGNVTAIALFDGTNGQFGGPGLVKGTDGNFYGTTQYGGTGYNGSWGTGNGTVFVVTPSGQLTVLHSFSGADGSGLYRGLTLGSDGDFYGVTKLGGQGYNGNNSSGNGTIFKISPQGRFASLYSFSGGTDGAEPVCILLQGNDGYLYGTTSSRGAGGHGTVFKISPTGALTTIHSFSGPDGADPSAGLVQCSDGTFYGVTEHGGSSSNGTVFRMTTSGDLTTLHSFIGGTDGASPSAELTQGTDGYLYGMTSHGGAGGNGTVFKLSVPLPGVSATLSSLTVAPAPVASVPPTPAPPPPPSGLNTGLVAYYPFDGNANDASGNGYNATLMNSPSFVKGVAGSAIYLTGGSGYFGSGGQYVLLPYIPLTDYPAFTIALWAKIDGSTTLDAGQSLVSFGATHLPDGCGYVAINYSLGGQGNVDFNSGGPASDVSVTPFPSGCLRNWAHYALVYDNGTLMGFINGKVVATKAGVTAGESATSAGLGIDWFPDTPGGVSTRFIGAIDEVRIYNRALSSSEVAQLAQPNTTLASPPVSSPPEAGGSPIITRVTPILAQRNQTIIIEGRGFGNSPPKLISVGKSVDTDARNGMWPSFAIRDHGDGPDSWAAGRVTDGNFDAIGVKLVSWTDSKITLAGFGDALGEGPENSTWRIAPGDPLEIVVFGTENSGPATFTTTALPAQAPSPASPETNFNYFHDQLAPYGSWVEVPVYGWCWRPDTAYAVNPSWQPYCDFGHWVYTDSGWYWQSDYRWGEIAFHYGRWYLDASYGWLWVPDYTWGPSWVCWRQAEGYCGWAPLPPGAVFVAGAWEYRGRRVAADFDFGLHEGNFTFVAYDHFRDNDFHRYVLPRDRVAVVYKNTTIINNYRVVNNTIVNEGMGRERIERATGQKVEVVRTQEIQHPLPGQPAIGGKVGPVSSGERGAKQGERQVEYAPKRQELAAPSTSRMDVEGIKRSLSQGFDSSSSRPSAPPKNPFADAIGKLAKQPSRTETNKPLRLNQN